MMCSYEHLSVLIHAISFAFSTNFLAVITAIFISLLSFYIASWDGRRVICNIFCFLFAIIQFR